MQTYDVADLERRIASAHWQGRLEELEPVLRRAACELAVACNVLELSPAERIVRGSQMGQRMRTRVDELALALAEHDEHVAAA